METILIAEDDFIVRDNISVLLNEEGYETLIAEDGEEAYQLLLKYNPSLIISDIAMPKLDGFQLLEKIRKNERTKLLPVIFLSAKTERESVRKGMSLGGDDYITKPFRPEELLGAIQSKLDKQNQFHKEIQMVKENILKYLPHELKTPLVPILGYSDLILNNFSELEKDDVINIVAEIKIAGIRLSGWVEKYVLLSEILTELNSTSIENLKKDLKNNYICNSCEMNLNEIYNENKEWKARQGDISIELAAAAIPIQHDHFKFIIKELIENASKFSDSGTKIKLTGKAENEFYKITVEDDGYGFEDWQIKKIDMFEQFDRKKYQQNGNGLGLITIKNMMQLYGGKMNIESVKESNTKVVISLRLETEL